MFGGKVLRLTFFAKLVTHIGNTFANLYALIMLACFVHNQHFNNTKFQVATLTSSKFERKIVKQFWDKLHTHSYPLLRDQDKIRPLCLLSQQLM